MTQRPVKIGMILYLPQYNSYYAVDVFIIGNCVLFNGMSSRLHAKPPMMDFIVDDIGKGWSRDDYLVMPAIEVKSMSDIANAILNTVDYA